MVGSLGLLVVVLWKFLLAFVVVVLFVEILSGCRVRRFVLVLGWWLLVVV
jgi:hypothetical protein